MTKDSWAVFYELLACGPLESRTVDVPPLNAIVSTPVGDTDEALMIHSYSLIILMIYL